MSLRLLTTPLVAISLFMSTSGCFKKEDASPTPNRGSFQLDGTSVSCYVETTRSAGSTGGTNYDFLDLKLTPIQGGGGVGRLSLFLFKVPGSPDNTYLLRNLAVYTSSNTSPYNFASKGFTLKATGDGSFSGSFAGVVSASANSIPGPYTTITNGVFTTVKF